MFRNFSLSPLFLLLSTFLHLFVVLSIVFFPSFFKKKPKKSPPIAIVQVVSVQQPKPPSPKKKKSPPAPIKKPLPKKEVKKAKEKPLKKVSKEVKPSKKATPEKAKPKKTEQDSIPTQAEESNRSQTQIATSSQVHPKLKLWIQRVGGIWESRWNPPAGIGILNTVEGEVQATILRSGVLTNMKLTKSSGNDLLDNQAQDALIRIGKFPPIPANYREKQQLTINFIFKYYGE